MCHPGNPWDESRNPCWDESGNPWDEPGMSLGIPAGMSLGIPGTPWDESGNPCWDESGKSSRRCLGGERGSGGSHSCLAISRQHPINPISNYRPSSTHQTVE